jgi:hypothetical protein
MEKSILHLGADAKTFSTKEGQKMSIPGSFPVLLQSVHSDSGGVSTN